MGRYDQCGTDCTVDCGHCKGAGKPRTQLAFRATCKRTEGSPAQQTRCDETFTDRAAFDAHMAGTHGKRKLTPGGASVTYSNPKGKAAPGWRAGKPEEPTPWKAPRPTAGGLEKVARDLAAGKYDLDYRYAGGTYTETVRMGEVA